MPWLSVEPRKLRRQIDNLLAQMKELPPHHPRYASYVRKTLQSYGKVNVLVTELKSDALKERHWKQLMKQLRVNWILSDITLGQVWDIDLQKNEPIVRDVILVAQGEYLENERSLFPRFYFVGDEDLLEIIGNSKNIPRLQKHFKKLFAGVSTVLLNEDIVLGIASREGEEVRITSGHFTSIDNNFPCFVFQLDDFQHTGLDRRIPKDQRVANAGRKRNACDFGPAFSRCRS